MQRKYSPRSPIADGIAGRCPRCGEGRMFQGLFTVAPSCTACELDFSFADSADGPAVFVMLFAGAIVAGVALWVEFTYEPAWWVHVMIQLPLVLLVCLPMLRGLKGVLIALQYANKAEEGRLER
jgi:uncharacterized protein (DUF983 family)